MTQKPFAQAAYQNRHDILAVLQQELLPGNQVLELGSGTGQHVCHFAPALADIDWQPSELAHNLAGIAQWLEESGHPNIQPPIELDIRWTNWPELNVDVCYSANTFHIVSWASVVSAFKGCSKVLVAGGKLMVYGPFSINGEHTARSNQQFDQHLRAEDPQSGVRDISDLDRVAEDNGFTQARLVEMPVNNFIAVWQKIG